MVNMLISGLLLIVRSDRDEMYSSATSLDFVDANMMSLRTNKSRGILIKLRTGIQTAIQKEHCVSKTFILQLKFIHSYDYLMQRKQFMR